MPHDCKMLPNVQQHRMCEWNDPNWLKLEIASKLDIFYGLTIILNQFSYLKLVHTGRHIFWLATTKINVLRLLSPFSHIIQRIIHSILSESSQVMRTKCSITYPRLNDDRMNGETGICHSPPKNGNNPTRSKDYDNGLLIPRELFTVSLLSCGTTINAESYCDF